MHELAGPVGQGCGEWQRPLKAQPTSLISLASYATGPTAEAVAAALAAAGNDAHALLRVMLAASGRHASSVFEEPAPLTVPDPPCTVATLTVRVDLRGARPPIWRRLELAGDLTLDRVHAIMQAAMGWWDGHLDMFRPPGGVRAFLTASDLDEGDEGLAEADVRLDQVLRDPGDRLDHHYDVGDGWEHVLLLEAVGARADGDPPARCLVGRGACPPEDVGGIDLYNTVAAGLRGAPGAGPPDQDLLEWLPDGFDPDVFDLAEAQDAVAHALDPDRGGPASWS